MRCAFCSLTVFVREQSFSIHRVACQPMDLLVSSKFVLSQIDVLSFSDCPLILVMPCSFDLLQSAPRLLSLA